MSDRPVFEDSEGRPLFERVTPDQAAAALKIAAQLKDGAEWQEADSDTGFWIGRFGCFELSFCEDDDGAGSRPFVAVLEADAEDGAMATIAVEAFEFSSLDDAKARAVRLLLLAIGPLASLLALYPLGPLVAIGRSMMGHPRSGGRT